MTHHYRNDTHRELHELLCSDLKLPPDVRLDVAHMHKAMCDAVNLYRSRLGKAPISVADVEKTEQMALGHVDYGTKFALYCCELVEKI